jgi:hypothetical protein
MIMSMKNSNDTIGNRTRDLPVCSTVTVKNLPIVKLQVWNMLKEEDITLKVRQLYPVLSEGLGR